MMKRKLIFIIVSLVVLVAALLIPESILWLKISLYVISYLIVGCEILIKAVKNIFHGKVFDENFLMAIATIGAFAIQEFPEAVAVMLLYQVGELFQSYAVRKSRKSISDLMNIRPDYANIMIDGTLTQVDPETIEIDDVIVVLPGEKIPLDGVVIEGTTMLDTSALTGESVPRSADLGDEVLSGCINMQGLIKIKVRKKFFESTVTKILDLVENASSKKSSSENFITKFARYYTPIVVVSALLLAVLPPLIDRSQSFQDWIYRALSFLVVSCPCALVISVPLSFFGGIGGASKAGILIKGSNYLETLSRTKVVVFDKTGTLTKGVFKVQTIASVGIDKDELLYYAAYAESFSNHPIAKSLAEAYGKTIDKSVVSNIQEMPGHGIVAVVDKKEILIGNLKLMNQFKIKYSYENVVGTVVHIAIDKEYCGYILIADEIKDDARVAISSLKSQGISKTIMLTGDNKEIANEVASNLCIDEVYSELLPADKVEKIEEIFANKSSKEKLVFVGDGINDAPVLARADIGIAMGGLGSDAAIEAADVVIMTDEPSKISLGIEISKKTLRIVKQNIIFALVVKAVVLILAACGIATMWEAVFGDVGVSIIAILNSFRALRISKK